MIVYTDRGAAITVGEAIRTVAPVGLVVSIDEAKEHLRLTSDQEIASVLRLIRAATSYVEDYCGLGLLTQTWEQRWSAWPDFFKLTRRPLQAVTSVEDLTVGSPFTPLAASTYVVGGVGWGRRSGTISLATGGAWPTLTGTWNEAVRVTYTVGFGDAPEDVPEMLRHAVLLLISLWFDNRDAPNLEPVHNMLADWRPFGIA